MRWKSDEICLQETGHGKLKAVNENQRATGSGGVGQIREETC